MAAQDAGQCGDVFVSTTTAGYTEKHDMRRLATLAIILVAAAPAIAGPRHRLRHRHFDRDALYEHYGESIVAADTLAIGLFGGGLLMTATLDTEGRMVGMIPLVVGGGIYVFGGLAVHSSHRNERSSYISPWLKAVLPLAGAYLGERLWPSNETGGALLGGAVGVFTATGIDALVLARAQGPYVAPSERGGAIVGISGRF